MTIRGLSRFFLRLPRLSPLQRYVGAILLVVVAAALQALIVAEAATAPFVLFFLAVAAAASLGGVRPGLLAVLLSAGTANYYFIVPLGAWSTTPHALAATVLFLASASSVALLSGVLRETLLDLHRAQRDLSRAQAVAHVGSWRLDVRRGELLWSEETHRMFGVPKGTTLTYDTFLALVHPEDRARLDAAWQAALGGARYDVEHRILVEGRVKWVHERAELEFDGAGALCGGFGTVQDVTERKETLEALRVSEERLRTMFDSAGAAIAQLDLVGGKLERANLGFSDLTGYPQDELQGLDYLALVHPEERAEAAAVLARDRAGDVEAGYFAQRRYVRRDGRVLDVEVYGRIVYGGASVPIGALLVVIDVTSRKKAARELAAAHAAAERAKADAEEASRAKDEFLAVLSHELRTPLAPVLTGISLLERAETLSDRGRHFVEVVRRNVELEARLIDDLLDVTRISRGRLELEPQLVDLRTIIDRVVEVCRPDIDERRLRFGVDHGPGPYQLRGDPARLQQVFWNLVKNAVKFTPHEGCVAIRCRPDGDSVVVEVSDSGVGIHRADLGRIFDAFSQPQRSSSSQHGGLGLGLTISRTLTEMHGGRIDAFSEGAGRGAVFRVRLPILSCGQRGAEEAAPAVAERPTARGRRVLLVEDHCDTAETMVAVLELEGHDVATAGDVATALAILGRERFDVLISDLGLPDRSGLELMRELRSRGWDGAAVALSGYGLESDVEKSRAAGFHVHLVKPVTPERLLEVVGRVAAERGGEGEALAAGATGGAARR